MNENKIEQLARALSSKVRRDHFGEKNATTADKLVVHLGLSNDRDLRDVISYARAELHHPIVSTFSGGYCYASGWEDNAYQHCIAQRVSIIRANIKVIEDIARAMEGVYGPPQLFTTDRITELEVLR